MNDTVLLSGQVANTPRVAFVGDFLRFSLIGDQYLSSQSRNVAWLFALLTGDRHTLHESGATFQLVAPVDAMALGAVAGREKLALDGYRLDPELAWASRFDTHNIDVFSALFDQLCTFDLVVGFEMAPTIKRRLSAAGVRYVNFFIHPLRMLRDLCLGATTNCARIVKALDQNLVEKEEIESQVRRFSALCQFRNLPTFALPRDVPVLIGQTARDSVLIDQGRFSDWADHLDVLRDMLKGTDTVVFIEHPYRPDSRRIIEVLRGRLGKTVLATNGNGYGLLFSNPKIPLVLTLASSLGVEAQAMGLPTQFILGDPRERLCLNGVESGPSGPLGHGIFTQRFMGVLLQRSIEPWRRPSKTDGFVLGDNYVRSTLDAWSFGLLQNGLVGANVRRIVYPAGGVGQRGLQEVCRQLGDTGNSSDDAIARRLQGIEQSIADLPLSAGETRHVEFGGAAAAQYLGEGFHAAEPWGVWTRAPSAIVCVALDPSVVSAGGVLDVTLQLRVYEGVLANCPVVRVSREERVFGYAFFRPTTPAVREIRFSISPACTYLEIKLCVSHLASPASVDGRPDDRLLGIALSGIGLSCREPCPLSSSQMLTFIDLGEHRADMVELRNTLPA